MRYYWDFREYIYFYYDVDLNKWRAIFVRR